MARAKKNATPEVVEEIKEEKKLKIDEPKKSESINTEDLLALIAQMKQTMESQAKQIEELKATPATQPQYVPQQTFNDSKNAVERRTVTITSMYKGGTLMLHGDHDHWLNFGQSESMSAKEAIKIVENVPQFLEQGFFIIDQWLIDEFGWAVNEHLMTQEELSKFFELPDNEAVELFMNTTPGQRTCIVDYIEARILGDGQFENINLAQQIGNLIGKNYIKLLSDNAMDDEDRAAMRSMRK